MEAWAGFEQGMYRSMRWIGGVLAGWFVRMGLRPNQVTVGRFLVFAPLTLVAYSWPGYWGPMLGLLAQVGSSAVDFCDGVMARRTGILTQVGGWYDGRYDFLMQCVLLAGAITHGVLEGWSVGWLLVGVAAWFSQAALIHHTDMFSGLYNCRPAFFRDMDSLPRGGPWQRLLVDVVITRSGVSVFLFSFRYWVLLGTVLGRLDWMLAAIAVTQHVRWIVLHGVMARLLTNEGRDGPVWQAMWGYVKADYTVPSP